MLYDGDIDLVEKAVMLGFRSQDSCNAWKRIKDIIGKSTKPTAQQPHGAAIAEQICPHCNGQRCDPIESTEIDHPVCPSCGGSGKLPHAADVVKHGVKGFNL